MVVFPELTFRSVLHSIVCIQGWSASKKTLKKTTFFSTYLSLSLSSSLLMFYPCISYRKISIMTTLGILLWQNWGKSVKGVISCSILLIDGFGCQFLEKPQTSGVCVSKIGAECKLPSWKTILKSPSSFSKQQNWKCLLVLMPMWMVNDWIAHPPSTPTYCSKYVGHKKSGQ